MLPFKSHMIDEVLVEYKDSSADSVIAVCITEGLDEEKWKITSHPHHDAMALIKTGDDMQEVLFSDGDLMAFKKLGYAVCHNRLDEHGKKVYIHHNMRTFKEKVVDDR